MILFLNFRLKRIFQKNDAQALDQLLKAGLNPDYCFQGTELIFHTLENDEFFEILIRYQPNLDVSIPNKSYTPLIAAIKKNRTKTALRLIKLGCDTRLVSFAGLEPLIYALEMKEPDVAGALLDKEESIEYLKGVLEFSKKHRFSEESLKQVEERIAKLQSEKRGKSD
ncbi:MAG TPA: hypothetical protein DHW82_00795 [Spirochaetia bacterium]|nr:MAG: hypothetical protein A2Y41_10200 [Spirochaetes bacterium GWB1_36_13]HCL55535.1 hypothetical protein [Spirochaetia bacterium]